LRRVQAREPGRLTPQVGDRLVFVVVEEELKRETTGHERGERDAGEEDGRHAKAQRAHRYRL
jgi:hypothetical protein